MAKARGFTLIELMITVAIVAILMAIAYPSYRNQVDSARRNEATNALLTGAQALERYYSINGRYLDTTTNALPLVYPTQVPENGPAHYTIAPSAQGMNTFTLRATRAGAMTGDRCGNFEINHAGTMSLQGNASGTTVADCWRR